MDHSDPFGALFPQEFPPFACSNYNFQLYIIILQISTGYGDEEEAREVTTTGALVLEKAATEVSTPTVGAADLDTKKIDPAQFISLKNLQDSTNINGRIVIFVSNLIARNINSTVDEYELNANLYRKFSNCSVREFPQSFRDKAMGCGAGLGMNFVRHLKGTQGHEKIANMGLKLYNECYDSSANKRSGIMSYIFKPKPLAMDKSMCVRSNGTNGLDSTLLLEHIYRNLRFDGETLDTHLNNVDECIFQADQAFFNHC